MGRLKGFFQQVKRRWLMITECCCALLLLNPFANLSPDFAPVFGVLSDVDWHRLGLSMLLVFGFIAASITLIWLITRLTDSATFLGAIAKDIGQDKGQLIIVHVVILSGLLAFYCYTPFSATDPSTAWVNWFTMVTAVLALAIWATGIYERWKESLPKKLTVVFVFDHHDSQAFDDLGISKTAQIVAGYIDAALPHTGDVRALGQTLGAQLYEVIQLKFDPGKIEIIKHITPVCDRNGVLVMRSLVVIPLDVDHTINSVRQKMHPQNSDFNERTFLHIQEEECEHGVINRFVVQPEFWQQYQGQAQLIEFGFPSQFTEHLMPLTRCD